VGAASAAAVDAPAGLRHPAGVSITVIVENDTIKLPMHVPDGTKVDVTLPESPAPERLTAREAFRRLQSQPRLTAAQAEEYLGEVRAERLAGGRRNGR
jgi:hypothetical protein